MPLKPIFDKAPLTAMNAQPLRAGLVRVSSPAMVKLYSLAANVNEPTALEGVFRLACMITAKPAEEPVAAKIRALLASQREDGSFAASFKDSVGILRAAWALYEYEARKPLLEHLARWCTFAAKHWDDLMADDDIWTYSADLLELLENLYRVTGKAAVLSLCERTANQTMSWSGVLNTISSQRPTSKAISCDELVSGLNSEKGSREGYYTHFRHTNHAESLADGARSTMAKGCYSGSATELNATQTGWERLFRYHGAVCGGLTSDELLEGTSPAQAISTAALGAWAEALSAAAMGDRADWAFNALERMVYNAMPACLQGDQLLPFQHVNTLKAEQKWENCFFVADDHAQRALIRLVRGYAAVAAAAVTARQDGASVNLYMPGRYAVPVNEELLVLDVSTSPNGATITIHAKKEVRMVMRLRVPAWSKNAEIYVNGSDSHCDVKNNTLTLDRTWHDGDVVTLQFEQTLYVGDGHHQGKYVLRGPVVMALPADRQDWRKAFLSASCDGSHVTAMLAQVKNWKEKDYLPADLPVLPETEGNPVACELVPYARAAARIALFPGRKQA